MAGLSGGERKHPVSFNLDYSMLPGEQIPGEDHTEQGKTERPAGHRDAERQDTQTDEQPEIGMDQCTADDENQDQGFVN